MTDNTEALPPLPEIVQRADHHFIGEGLAEAVIEYALAQRQQVPERVKYVPVDPRLRNQNWDHPNDDEKCSPECKQALNARGDDEGQGLDGYWKWGFKAGWNAHAALTAAPSAQAEPQVPLTDEQIDKLPFPLHEPDHGGVTVTEALRLFARAIERAHGISKQEGK